MGLSSVSYWYHKYMKAFVESAAKAVILIALGALMLRWVLLQIMPEPPPELLLPWQSIFDGTLFFTDQLRAVPWDEHLTRLSYSCVMAFMGLVISSSISLVLGYQMARKPQSGYWQGIASLFTLTSGFPLFVVGLVGFVVLWHINFQDGSMLNLWSKIILGGVILGSCEGALGEWPRNFRSIFTDLQEKTYYLAHQARGQKTYGLAYRTIRPYLWQSLATRISYLFGGVIVVERALDLRGAGYGFIDAVLKPGANYLAYRDAMIYGILIMLVPITVRMIITAQWQRKAQRVR